MKENLFFELIQVSLGTRMNLSHTLNVDEWDFLYNLAQKQALLGICFVGVQRVYQQHPSLKHLQYLKWMGMSVKIQQKNELHRETGNVLLSKLKGDGIDACVLKGLSLTSYYGDIGSLRQSGDIDLWIRNRSIMDLDSYVKCLGFKTQTTAAHVRYETAEGIVIELHVAPAFFRSFINDRKFRRWFESLKNKKVSFAEFNLVYLMVHMYHHVLFEGLGLRQLMDYYYVLKNINSSPLIDSRTSHVPKIVAEFGMRRFACGIMWIMKEVFALEDRYFIFESDEKYGRLILDDVMKGGNMGHHNERNRKSQGVSAVVRSLIGLKRNMKFFALGPMEILSSPLWSTWHWLWRKRHGFL